MTLHRLSLFRPGDRDRLLTLSDERDAMLRRVLDAERRGYALGFAAGEAEGWQGAEAVAEQRWAAVARGVLRPEDEAEQAAKRRLRLAEAMERTDALQHEATVVQRAFNTSPRDRTPVQRAICHTYRRDGRVT